MVRVKICGITRVEDALAAAHAGADAIGLVFYAASPRAISVEQACAIQRALPPFISTVGLFVDASADQIRQVLTQVRLDMLQFHGNEPDDFCQQFGIPYLKAIRVRPGQDVNAAAAQWPGACGILLDSYRPGIPGGTGEVFDWTMIPAERKWSLILAGGLDAGNIQQAISLVAPWAVDVSGGVELSKGKKDIAKINAFIGEAKRV